MDKLAKLHLFMRKSICNELLKIDFIVKCRVVLSSFDLGLNKNNLFCFQVNQYRINVSI